jgi:hypothetical protein
MNARPAPTEIEWCEDGVLHIDVRGLRPPEPMVAILGRIAQLAPGASLLVHLDRDPLLLYPELAEIGWEARRMPSPAGEVRLLLRAAP